MEDLPTGDESTTRGSAWLGLARLLESVEVLTSWVPFGDHCRSRVRERESAAARVMAVLVFFVGTSWDPLCPLCDVKIWRREDLCELSEVSWLSW